MKALLHSILFFLAAGSLFAAPQYTLGWGNESTTYTVADGPSSGDISGNTVWLTANQSTGLSLTIVSVSNLNLRDYTLKYVVCGDHYAYRTGTLGDLGGDNRNFSIQNVNATESIAFFVSSAAYGTDSTWVEGIGQVSVNGNYVIQSGNGTITLLLTPGPAGQPLPGVLTSLMLGGAIGGFYLRRKQKAA